MKVWLNENIKMITNDYSLECSCKTLLTEQEDWYMSLFTCFFQVLVTW